MTAAANHSPAAGGPDDRHLTNTLAALALALSDRIRESTEEAAGHAAAGPSALVALREFLGRGSIDQLRAALGLSHSGAVRLVDRLTRDGYVERHPGADGRSVALVLTRSGHVAARQVLAARAAAVETALAGLSAEDLRTLDTLTGKILRTVTEERLADRGRGRPPSGGWLCRLCDFAACGREDGACPTATTAQAHRT